MVSSIYPFLRCCGRASTVPVDGCESRGWGQVSRQAVSLRVLLQAEYGAGVFSFSLWDLCGIIFLVLVSMLDILFFLHWIKFSACLHICSFQPYYCCYPASKVAFLWLTLTNHWWVVKCFGCPVSYRVCISRATAVSPSLCSMLWFYPRSQAFCSTQDVYLFFLCAHYKNNSVTLHDWPGSKTKKVIVTLSFDNCCYSR